MTDATPTGAPGGQGSAEEPAAPVMNTTDPAVMRALAHPLRIDLLEQLTDLDEATASELAARLDQSVANCSFHLRILAAGGFIERAEPRGREKPWRSVHSSRSMRPDRDDPMSVAEASELGALYVQREAARVIKFLRESMAYVDNREWILTVSVNTHTFWATAEELVQLNADLTALMDRFEGRTDPAKRPEGARKSRLFATLNPDLVLDTAAPRDDRDTDDDLSTTD